MKKGTFFDKLIEYVKAILLYIKIYWSAIRRFNEDGCSILAAGISFYALISIIPLFLLVVSAVGYVMSYPERFLTRIYKAFPDANIIIKEE